MKKEIINQVRKEITKSISEFFNVYNCVFLIQLSLALSFGTVLLDYFDIPSQVLAKFPDDLHLLSASVIIFLIILRLANIHAFDLFRVSSVNALDAFSLVMLITSVCYGTARGSILGKNCYSRIALWFAAVMGAVILIRCTIRIAKQIKAQPKQRSLTDLRELYENNFTRIPGEPILILEKDVDYDLVGRDRITNQLYHSIMQCQDKQSYVISLEGAWGTGKTTILNNTKRLLLENKSDDRDIIVVDDFDPWLYGSQEALLVAMLDTLFHHAGLKYSPARSNKMAKALSKIIADSHVVGGLISTLVYDRQEADISKMKNRISSFLNSSNKTIVFFIDNLDRANDDNIIFLFKLISIVFDLPRVVYVLAFERDRIDCILNNTHEIDSRFTEKIIQQEINIPAISKEKEHLLYSVCMSNLLAAYGVPKSEIRDSVKVMEYIISRTKNIRAFKRMLNSVFSAFAENTELNKRDLLAIEAIRFFDMDLYISIYEHPPFFISHEKSYSEQFHLGLSQDEFNKVGAAFFNDLLPKFEDAKEMLAEIFPYVRRHIGRQSLASDYGFSDSNANEIAKNAHICNGKYFDLYFSFGSNNYLRIQKDVKALVAKINSADSRRTIANLMCSALERVSLDDQREWLEHFQLHIPDIKGDKIFFTAVTLYQLVYVVKDSGWEFLRADPRRRAAYIVADLLSRCSDNEFDNFLTVIQNGYDRLGTISSILSWLKKEKKSEFEPSNRWELLSAKYSEMCEYVVSHKLNLYSDEFYHEENILGMYYHYSENNQLSLLTNYIRETICAKNMYRLLWDAKKLSVSSFFTYSIDEKLLKILIGDTALIDNLILEYPPATDDEQFVWNVYNAFRCGELDDKEQNGVRSETVVLLQL